MKYVLIALAVIAVIAIIALIIKKVPSDFWPTPTTKGQQGENLVSSVLGGTKPNEQYQIDDLIITRKDGMTTQIDHVFINKNGIWSIETKNYSGMIFGDESQQEWTQTLNYGEIKNHFYNPLKQNNTHVYWLNKILRPNHKINSLVVFIDADISNVSAPNVIEIKDLRSFINQNLGYELTVNEMEKYYNKLLKIKENNQVSLEEHINNIHKMQDSIEHHICPRCGGKLVIKHGQNGDFYGCENFPKCRFKKPLD